MKRTRPHPPASGIEPASKGKRRLLPVAAVLHNKSMCDPFFAVEDGQSAIVAVVAMDDDQRVIVRPCMRLDRSIVVLALRRAAELLEEEARAEGRNV